MSQNEPLRASGTYRIPSEIHGVSSVPVGSGCDTSSIVEQLNSDDTKIKSSREWI
jgi:hypothetical protein